MVIDNIELSVYAEAAYSPLRFLNFNLGLRASHALMAGVERPILQPRLSAKAFLSENFSLLASYNRHAQFVHLVSNSNIGAPSDLWLPIMEGIPPQEAEQYTFGGAYTISKGFQFSAEAYYKDFNNLLEFRPDEIINHNVTNWAEVTLLGTGTSKGGELLLVKTTGKRTGWLAYTLSKTDRTFEGINDGKTFPFKYDRTHNISIMAAHQLSANKQLSVTWVYTSGYYITLQFDNYFLPLPDQTMCIANYRVKNNFRTPAYHRLDLSYSVKKQKKKGVRVWSYGLYNAYSRVNPFMIVYDDVLEEKRDENGHLDGYKVIDRRLIMMGLFPIIPSVSYTYTF
jgi:outer membrane receptor protein involved in Fe transport